MITPAQIAQTFSLTTPTPTWLQPVTAKDFSDFLDSKIPEAERPRSVLYQCGDAWMQAEAQNHVNGVYLFAHACLESGWGMSEIAHQKFNLFGFNAIDVSPSQSATTFSTPADSVMQVSTYIAAHYLTPGGKYYSDKYGPTLEGMNVRYATDPAWHIKIARIMWEFAEFLMAKQRQP